MRPLPQLPNQYRAHSAMTSICIHLENVVLRPNRLWKAVLNKFLKQKQTSLKNVYTDKINFIYGHFISANGIFMGFEETFKRIGGQT